MVPTFGIDTIRRITSDASERKKLAARDYEDYLQVIIAAFVAVTETHTFLDDYPCH
jgi:hypothetical protein